MGVRRLIVVAIGVVALSLLGPTAAGAQTGVLTLTGERLDACHAERAGGVTFICLSPETGPDSFRATVRCNESGVNERVTWSASGIASGPYPGTFTETGSAVATNSRVTALVVEFHIESVLGDVDGRKFIHPDEVAPFALCRNIPESSGFLMTVDGTVRYEAIIKPASGGSFADEGESSILLHALTAESPFVAEAETTIGSVSETFASTLTEASPILPGAKEQCKDQGFVIFGVFENQGDCVSFVSTHGKNEPGQNLPGVP